MTIRVVNTTLLALIVVSLLTGVYVIFVNHHLWLMHIHRITGLGTLLLLPWKVGISLASLKRGWDWSRFDRGVGMVISLILAGLAVASTLFALVWVVRVGPFVLWLYQTVLAWHWILALMLLVPLTIHVWRRWPKPKMAEFTSRRGLLRSGALLGGSLLAWVGMEAVGRARATEAEPRRITGSRGRGEFTGNDFPRTGEWIQPLDVTTWSLRVTGAVNQPFELDYDTLLASEQYTDIATLDCTLGWYTTQAWRGVPLMSLLEQAGVEKGAVGFLLTATSGYAMPYTLPEAKDILLCTHIGDEVLSHEHGFPVRAVVPHRRGWFWVKWLSEIKVVRALPDVEATINRIEKGSVLG